MIDPDLRIADDDQAHLDVYETYWAHWRGVFRQSDGSTSAFYRHFYTVEFRQPSADVKELVEAFDAEHRAFVRKAYRRHDAESHHFAVVALSKADDGLAVRGLAMVHPDAAAHVCATVHRWKGRRSGLMLTKVRHNHLDLDCRFRLLTEILRQELGVIADCGKWQ